ncbi:MAG: SPFH domain-containing protein [Parvularculales bacterium]
MSLLYTIPQNQALVIERLGKFNRVQREGIAFKLPFIEEIKNVSDWGAFANRDGEYIELAEQQLDTPRRQCQTSDNVTVSTNASIYYRIIDIQKAVYEVDNMPRALGDIALNALRSEIGRRALDNLLKERQNINESISAALSEATGNWGISLSRVEVQELDYSSETADAMLQQMSAERRQRALVSEATGEADAIKLKAKAQAEAIRMIAEAESDYIKLLMETLDKDSVAQILLSQKYLQGMELISKNPGDKVFIPNSFQALMELKSD